MFSFVNFKRFPAGGEVAIVALVVAIISLMILPLPTVLIDILLGINITISVTLLMITMYIPRPASLSVFPSLLLFTTLYRLSLNIASTKSILLHADAGHIIESFGELVVGGNLVVGMVVFLIITTVQFIVIAKGSERVAEVGARFTLDALPGKQMSIDADLRANLLTPDEARAKRSRLALESQLNGGMDGAMKFVKGDAVAGLIITAVNIIAGIAVGVAYHGMAVVEAANRFAILSIGDAMVSQIPSLLLSVAAGVMLTRVNDEQRTRDMSLGHELGQQLAADPRALYFAAAVLAGFSFVPGFPVIMFIVLAATLAVSAWHLSRRKRAESHPEDTEPLPSMQRFGVKQHAPVILPHAPQFSCPLGVRFAPDLFARVNSTVLDQAFGTERARLQAELGLPFPGITVWTDERVASSHCEITIHDVPQLRLELPVGELMLRPDASQDEAQEIAALRSRATSRPSLLPHGEPTWWIRDPGTALRGLVWRAEQVVAHASIEMLRRNAAQYLGIQEVQWLTEQLGSTYPGLVTELQKALPPQKIADVLRRLVEENVPIRNLRAITESLIAWGPKEKDMLMLAEYVRGDLSRFLAHRAARGKASVSAVFLDVGVEQYVRQSIKQTPTGNYLALRPDETTLLIEQIESFTGTSARDGVALVTSMDIRRYVRRMIESRLPWLEVYSYQELDGHLQLQPLGRVVM